MGFEIYSLLDAKRSSFTILDNPIEVHIRVFGVHERNTAQIGQSSEENGLPHFPRLRLSLIPLHEIKTNSNYNIFQFVSTNASTRNVCAYEGNEDRRMRIEGGGIGVEQW